MKNQLEKLREKIDLTDDKIISLLGKRFSLVKTVGKFKKERNLPALDSIRWQKVLESIMKKGENSGINPSFLKKIYEAIHKEALKIEKSL